MPCKHEDGARACVTHDIGAAPVAAAADAAGIVLADHGQLRVQGHTHTGIAGQLERRAWVS